MVSTHSLCVNAPSSATPARSSRDLELLEIPDHEGRGGLLQDDFSLLASAAAPYTFAIRCGSLGVRGLLSAVQVPDCSTVTRSCVVRPMNEAIALACDTLRTQGIRRVHAIFAGGDTDTHGNFRGAGFAACEGETFFELPLRAERGIVAPLAPPGYEVRGACENDVGRLEHLIGAIPELAILEWEWSLVRRGLASASRQALVVESDGDLVGALIGGHSCGRATVSHLWVDSSHRHLGLGRTMSLHALARFKVAGVETVHVMTTAGNTVANGFWAALGFRAEGAHVFLEKDL